jgi:hypothetical protein
MHLQLTYTSTNPANLHSLTLDRRPNIILGRPTIRTNLPRLIHHLLQLLLLNPPHPNQQLHPQPHIQILHTPHQMYRALDNRILRRRRHLDAQRRRNSIHGRLETRAVAGREEFLRVGLAFVAGPAERFGHG